MTRNAKVQIAGKLSYREQLEAYFREHPTASENAAANATGSPRTVAGFVRRKLVAAGVVRSTGPRGRANLWASL